MRSKLSAEIQSDHFLVRAKIKLKIKRIGKTKKSEKSNGILVKEIREKQKKNSSKK